MSTYSNEIVRKIWEIHNSDLPARRKILDIFTNSSDWDKSTTSLYKISELLKKISETKLENRFSNKLVLYVMFQIQSYGHYKMQDVEKIAEDFIKENSGKQDIYDNRCYPGAIDEDREGNPITAHFPDQLQAFTFSYVVLKVINSESVMDIFSDRDPIRSHHRRAYDILADLDREVLKCVDSGEFPYSILIPYKDDGDVIFNFSHFEVDIKEPYTNFRTLFVVYSYQGSIS